MFFRVPTRHTGTNFTAHLHGWAKLDDGLWGKVGGIKRKGVRVVG